MTAGLRHRLDNRLPDFFRHMAQIFLRDLAQVGRHVDAAQKFGRLSRGVTFGHSHILHHVQMICRITDSQTGGHLGAGLGVVELTVALHYVFNTPDDKLIWDVSHQCYPHKTLTGRKGRLNTLRTGGGLSGFTSRAESELCPSRLRPVLCPNI